MTALPVEAIALALHDLFSTDLGPTSYKPLHLWPTPVGLFIHLLAFEKQTARERQQLPLVWAYSVFLLEEVCILLLIT